MLACLCQGLKNYTEGTEYILTHKFFLFLHTIYTLQVQLLQKLGLKNCAHTRVRLCIVHAKAL